MENQETTSIQRIKLVNDEQELEFDFDFPSNEESKVNNIVEKTVVEKNIQEIDNFLKINNQEILWNDLELERLTNSSDGVDNALAISSGIFAAIIDSLWVGRFDFTRGNNWSDQKVNDFVTKVAKKSGYKGNDLDGAIRHLEQKYGAPSDSVTAQLGGGRQHHLRDFAHHPTVVGFLFSMLTQFTMKAYGTNTQGLFTIVDIQNTCYIGKNIPEKVFFGSFHWIMHLISDMAGSSSYAGQGTGIPGPILSTLKEISSLPIFQNQINKDDNSEFSVWISKLFNGTLLGEHDENGKIIKESAMQMRFDLRAEIGVGKEIGRQAIPVLINECIVRGFYLLRRLAQEVKDKDIHHYKDLNKIDWEKVKPYKNRTIIRMLTISSGVLTTIDIADAAIRSAVVSGGLTPNFGKEFVLRINFVGTTRLLVAIGSDAIMGQDRYVKRSKRFEILSERLSLLKTKISYLQDGVWLSADSTSKQIEEVLEMMTVTTSIFIATVQKNQKSMIMIGQYLNTENIKQSGLNQDILKVLNGGEIK